MLGLADDEFASTTNNPGRFGEHEGLVGERIIGIDLDKFPFRL